MGRKRSELSPEERVRKLYNDEFHRRTRTMIDKAHDFKISFPAAQIHTLIEHLGKYYVYTSFDDSRRPPSVKNIRRTSLGPKIFTPASRGPLSEHRQAVLAGSEFQKGAPLPVEDDSSDESEVGDQGAQAGQGLYNGLLPSPLPPAPVAFQHDAGPSSLTAMEAPWAGLDWPVSEAATSPSPHTPTKPVGPFTPSPTPKSSSGQYDGRRFMPYAAAHSTRVSKASTRGRGGRGGLRRG